MTKAVKITLSVLVVLAIVAGAVYFFYIVPSMKKYAISARDTGRQMALKNISLQLAVNYSSEYPETLDNLPVDPLEGQKSENCEFTYIYTPSADRKSYTLDACMEVEKNANQPNNIYRISESLE